MSSVLGLAEEKSCNRFGEAREGHAELRALLPQRLDARFARLRFLVPDDDRHRSAARVGLLHLRLEARSAAMLRDAEAGVAQGLGNAKGEALRALALVDEVDVRRGAPALIGDERQQPLDAHREAARRRG